jgi:hypothetical protein
VVKDAQYGGRAELRDRQTPGVRVQQGAVGLITCRTGGMLFDAIQFSGERRQWVLCFGFSHCHSAIRMRGASKKIVQRRVPEAFDSA